MSLSPEMILVLKVVFLCLVWSLITALLTASILTFIFKRAMSVGLFKGDTGEPGPPGPQGIKGDRGRDGLDGRDCDCGGDRM